MSSSIGAPVFEMSKKVDLIDKSGLLVLDRIPNDFSSFILAESDLDIYKNEDVLGGGKVTFEESDIIFTFTEEHGLIDDKHTLESEKFKERVRSLAESGEDITHSLGFPLNSSFDKYVRPKLMRNIREISREYPQMRLDYIAVVCGARDNYGVKDVISTAKCMKINRNIQISISFLEDEGIIKVNERGFISREKKLSLGVSSTSEAISAMGNLVSN